MGIKGPSPEYRFDDSSVRPYTLDFRIELAEARVREAEEALGRARSNLAALRTQQARGER